MDIQPATWVAVAALAVVCIKEVAIAYFNYLERRYRNGSAQPKAVDRHQAG